MAGHEDDRNLNLSLSQLSLEFEAAHPRKPDMEDEAGGGVRQLALQEFGSGSEEFNSQANGAEQAAQGVANGGIVVDDEDDWRGIRGFGRERIMAHGASSSSAAARAGNWRRGQHCLHHGRK